MLPASRDSRALSALFLFELAIASLERASKESGSSRSEASRVGDARQSSANVFMFAGTVVCLELRRRRDIVLTTGTAFVKNDIEAQRGGKFVHVPCLVEV